VYTPEPTTTTHSKAYHGYSAGRPQHYDYDAHNHHSVLLTRSQTPGAKLSNRGLTPGRNCSDFLRSDQVVIHNQGY
jgi:hypothetical protein